MFSGKVIKGDGIGKMLGCPTANLDMSPEKTRLREGVYAGFAWFDHVTYKAGISVNHARGKVEVHLLDYSGDDFYGQMLAAEAVQQVSRMEPLESVRELKEKIQRDIVVIRAVLEEES